MGNSSCTKLELETHNAISSPPQKDSSWYFHHFDWWLSYLLTTEIIFWRLAKFFLDLCYLRNIKTIGKSQTGSFVGNHWSITYASYWFCGFGFKIREENIALIARNAQLSVTWLRDEVVAQLVLVQLLLCEKEQIRGVKIGEGGKGQQGINILFLENGCYKQCLSVSRLEA